MTHSYIVLILSLSLASLSLSSYTTRKHLDGSKISSEFNINAINITSVGSIEA